jgi:hypothetical protein
MKKRRSLGAVSHFVAFQQGLIELLDSTNATSSVISAAFEQRLDNLEDSNTGLITTVSNLSASISGNVADILALSGNISNNVSEIISLSSSVSSSVTSLSSSIFSVSGDVINLSSSVSSSLYYIEEDIVSLSSSVSSSLYYIEGDIIILSESHEALSADFISLSQSFALLSASIAEGGGLVVDIDDDAELLFDGDTLMTNADVYISGSGNNLYLHGTNTQGLPSKFEFSIRNGQTYIAEVPHSDFGDSVDDPWFRFDGETLLTHADIYVSGANNYLYMNGTDENGDYGIFYFDIINGQVHIKQTGSV